MEDTMVDESVMTIDEFMASYSDGRESYMRVRLERMIAAAVQAEREAMKAIVDPYVYALKHCGDRKQADLRDMANELDDAIRARSNGEAQPQLFDDPISDDEADVMDAEQEYEAAEFFGVKPVKPSKPKRSK